MLDSIDKAILDILRHNGRESISNLSMRLNIARATVRSRIDKLKNEGVIQGFSVNLGNTNSQPYMRAFCMIKISGSQSPQVERKLLKMPAVDFLHNTNGGWDMIAELIFRDLVEFNSILDNIRQINGIADTDTSILLATQRYKQ